MTKPAARSHAEGLRVLIAARGEGRIATLTKLLQSLGHAVARGDEEPDVVLADADQAERGRFPRVVLGGTDPDAEGLLPSNTEPAALDAALRAVARGLIVRSRVALSPAFSIIHEAEARPLLTPREAQVLDAIADGLTNKAIARRLGISLHTVKFHVESVFRKLGAGTRAEAVAKAIERRREETIDL